MGFVPTFCLYESPGTLFAPDLFEITLLLVLFTGKNMVSKQTNEMEKDAKEWG